MASGFIQLRRGIMDHLNQGDMSCQEGMAYVAMLISADRATGIWWGSAKALAAQFGRGDISERTARTLLENLESAKGRYIKRFSVERGRGNYAILINRFECSDGAQRGRRLNAIDTVDWRSPVYYDPRTERAAEGAAEGAAVAPSQEQELKQELKPRAGGFDASREWEWTLGNFWKDGTGRDLSATGIRALVAVGEMDAVAKAQAKGELRHLRRDFIDAYKGAQSAPVAKKAPGSTSSVAGG